MDNGLLLSSYEVKPMWTLFGPPGFEVLEEGYDCGGMGEGEGDTKALEEEMGRTCAGGTLDALSGLLESRFMK